MISEKIDRPIKQARPRNNTIQLSNDSARDSSLRPPSSSSLSVAYRRYAAKDLDGDLLKNDAGEGCLIFLDLM